MITDMQSVDIGQRLARAIFTKRGNHSEAHMKELELAGALAFAAETAIRGTRAAEMRAELQETEYNLTQIMVALGENKLPDAARHMILAIRDRNRALLARIENGVRP